MGTVWSVGNYTRETATIAILELTTIRGEAHNERQQIRNLHSRNEGRNRSRSKDSTNPPQGVLPI